MSKLIAMMPTVRSHCAEATSMCAILVGLGVASTALHWAVSALLY